MRFQHDVTRVATDEYVCDRSRGRIHRSVHIYSQRPVPGSPAVLERREEPGLFDNDGHQIATNRTISPGRRNVGSSISGVNISVEVLPIICYPPGDSRE